MSLPALVVEFVVVGEVAEPANVFPATTTGTVSSTGVVTVTMVATAAAAAADTVGVTLDAEPTVMADVDAAMLTLVATLPAVPVLQLLLLLQELLLPTVTSFFCCCSSVHSNESRHPGC